jgi:hypothetical protein
MIEITERDIKIMNILAQYGSVYVIDLKELYTGGPDYYIRRIQKLVKENYIIRNKKMLHLGFRGREYLEKNNISYRNMDGHLDSYRRASNQYKLACILKDFILVPSFKIERVITNNYAYKYYGKAINKEEQEYWIYKIKKTTIKETDDNSTKSSKLHTKAIEIRKIKKEMAQLGVNKRVIVLIEDKQCMDLYKSEETYIKLFLAEHILMANVESGYELLNKYVGEAKGSTENIINILRKKGLNIKDKDECDFPSADFGIDDNYGMNLTTSDYNKELKINDYMKTTRKNNITIICDEIQKTKYHVQFPKCTIVTVDLKNSEEYSNHTAIIEMAINHLQKQTDYVHGIAHTNDVVSIIKRVISQLDKPIDKEMCIIIGYWHDIGKIFTDKCYEKLSAKMLSEELANLDYPPEFIEKCSKAIESHRWNMKPETIEGEVLRDADSLTLISKDRWNSYLKSNQKLDSILKMLHKLRNEILHLEVVKSLYDEDIVELVKTLYMDYKIKD